MSTDNEARLRGDGEQYPEAAEVCGEAYQVVGSLLDDLGVFNTPQAEKVLDNLSQHRMVHKDVLPWPSFAALAQDRASQPAAVDEAMVERALNAYFADQCQLVDKESKLFRAMKAALTAALATQHGDNT